MRIVVSMKYLWILVTVVLAGFVSACAMTYPLVGAYYNYKESLTGRAVYNPFSGTSQLRLADRALKLQCEGHTYATYAPFFTLSGAGYGGEGELKCSDGRLFKLQWETLSWSTGYGFGRDQNGDRISFVFGMEQRQAEDFLMKELPAVLKQRR